MKKLTLKIVQQLIDDSTTVSLFILGEYINTKTRLLVICEVCQRQGYTTWDSISKSIHNKNTGCPHCARIKVADNCRKTQDKYLEELKYTNISVLDKYINSSTKIRHQCNKCDHIWEAIPNNILQGSICPICALSKRPRKLHRDYLADLKHLKVSVLEPYITAKTKIKHQCNICKNIWSVKPNNILQNNGCPICAKVVKQIGWEGVRTKEFKDMALKIACSLYIVQAKDCIKVGITNNTARRVKQLNSSGFSCSLLEDYELNAWDAVLIEQAIHSKFSSYCSKVKFGGHTELHHTDDLSDIMGYIQNEL